MSDETSDELRTQWNLSDERTAAEEKADRMWPEGLNMGQWDGIMMDQERALLVQRRAYRMGREDQWIRDHGGDDD